jgi:anaerobic selenocysteine-containing dehydrogenase
VQGVGSCGVSPTLKAAFAARLEETYGIHPPATHGQHTFATMEAAAAGRIRTGVLLGGNLFASNPDRAWAAHAMRRIGLTLSITTKLNEGHVHGRGRTAIVVPVLARDEESQATTQESMFNFVRLSEGGTPAVAGEMRSEVDVIAALAERVLPAGRFDWSRLRSHRALREEIARVVPGYAGIAAIDDTRREFTVEGRTFAEPRFPTADGRAHFRVTPLPTFAPAGDELRLMTIRSEGQFNTVVYDEEDVYRGSHRRDVVFMAPEDAAARGLAVDDRVVVETETGALEVSVVTAPIRPGNVAMFYPEANVIVPRRVDARSHTPAFKSVVARVTAVGARAEPQPGRQARA